MVRYWSLEQWQSTSHAAEEHSPASHQPLCPLVHPHLGASQCPPGWEVWLPAHSKCSGWMQRPCPPTPALACSSRPKPEKLHLEFSFQVAWHESQAYQIHLQPQLSFSRPAGMTTPQHRLANVPTPNPLLPPLEHMALTVSSLAVAFSQESLQAPHGSFCVYQQVLGRRDSLLPRLRCHSRTERRRMALSTPQPQGLGPWLWIPIPRSAGPPDLPSSQQSPALLTAPLPGPGFQP